jgi:hypothetical protein
MPRKGNMKKLERLLLKTFEALVSCYGKIDGCKIFKELIKYVKF